MKRSELNVGLVVEVQEGRTYPNFRRAIVLDTKPWTDGKYTQFSPFRPRRIDRGNGVAVAVETTDFLGHSKPSVWLPDVIQLTQLKPAGTEAALKAEQTAKWEQRERADADRSERETKLRERAEVQNSYALRFRYSRYGNGPGYFDTHTVELATKELERLLDERDELRRRVAELDGSVENVGDDDLTESIREHMRRFRAGAEDAREGRELTTTEPSRVAGYNWQREELEGLSFKGSDEE